MAGTAHPRSDGGASMRKAPTATNESGAFEIEQAGLFYPSEFSPTWPTHGIPADGLPASSGGKG
jgi:hypothetical protein